MERTEKEVVCVWTIASDTKDLDQIIELSMNVADYCDWRLYVDDVAFLHKQLLGFGAYRLDD